MIWRRKLLTFAEALSSDWVWFVVAGVLVGAFMFSIL